MSCHAIGDEHALRVLHDLVATPSVSGGERRAVEVFVRHAAALGLEVEIDEAGNGIATRRSGASPGTDEAEIVLLGHIDTVPGEIPVRIEGGELHGRGSVDAKGPLAAMLLAAAGAEPREGTRLVVAAAVGEETARSPGARFLATRLRPDACVIGEPSGVDGVTLGYKGRLLAHARCGLPGSHSAGPGGSAVDMLLGWWSQVLEHVARSNASAGREFERVQASVRSMSSDHTGLRDGAEMVVGFRLPPAIGPAELEAGLRSLAPDAVEVSFEGHERAHRVGRNDAVVRSLSAAIRARGMTPRPKLKTGTADLNVVAPVWRCPIAAYGPGDSGLDHAPDERLPLGEFLESVRVLRDALGRLSVELRSAGREEHGLAGEPGSERYRDDVAVGPGAHDRVEHPEHGR